MLRSMYSGVAGMRTHQTKLDVIGNNIANVNTYGFKASRTTFSEVYYQTTSAAKGADANSGGKNASQIGYGSAVSGIDILMTRSGFQSTNRTLDVAIAGEGFFQVKDADGNMYYSRSGNFSFDSVGNLVDSNGNFVLGTQGSTLGKEPGSEKIKVALNAVPESIAILEEVVNNKKITITSSNPTEDANVSFSFATDSKMADGQVCRATVSNGIINVYFNPSELITSEAELNRLVNMAITEANGNFEHPAGSFSIKIEGADYTSNGGLTGAELVSTNYNPTLGSITLPTEFTDDNNIRVSAIGNTFSANTQTSQDATYQLTPEADGTYTVQIEIGGKTYKGKINAASTASGTVQLSNTAAGADSQDYIILTHPGTTTLKNNGIYYDTATTTAIGSIDKDVTNAVAVNSEPSRALGLGSKQMTLKGGTAGGEQTLSDLTDIAIASDGTITATHSVFGLVEIGRIDIATFENPAGLTQAGTSYFKVSANSGEPNVSEAGTNGSGSLQSGALEMSNVDLSTEFADMITTERGFQASSRLITVSDEILQELVNLKR